MGVLAMHMAECFFNSREREESMMEPQTFPNEGRRRRVAIENVTPQIDAGRYPVKRTIGERVAVEARIFADSHDLLSGMVKYRTAPRRSGRSPRWSRSPMIDGGESLLSTEPGDYFYTVEAWIDRFKSWRDSFQKKIQTGQDVAVDLIEGARMIEESAQRAGPIESAELKRLAAELTEGSLAMSLMDLAARYSDRRFATTFDRELRVAVDPERARFSAWYEMFPRSFGTFKDCEAQLPRIAAMGFDVLYFPPIHPIGRSFRKGKNNSAAAQPGEPGSPWGIGAAEGGHKSVHPELGRWRIFGGCCGRRAIAGLKLRWTSLCNARPTILMSKNIRNGFANVPTAPSITRRTRRKNTRTFTRSISSARIGGDCGRS